MESALAREDWTLNEAHRVPLASVESVENGGEITDYSNGCRLPTQVPAKSQQPWEFFSCLK
jgi:hypothetical protein